MQFIHINNTIIDGGQPDSISVVTFDNIENNSSLINFTIQNGISDYGGGIYSFNSSPLLQNLIIQNNLSTNGGGGVFCYDSSPVMEDISIYSNTSNDVGGGMYLKGNSDPICTRIFINDNIGGGAGGAIFIRDNIMSN